MKIASILLLVLAIAGVAVYVDGSRLPVDHTVSVSGVVNAPPEKVFSLITNVETAPDWRPTVRAVTLLDKDQGRDHWVEHLAHGQFMTFLATRTDPPMRREVARDDPNAAYGGTWTYELTPGPSASTTNLKITESGFIRSPLYRFVTYRVFGPTKNLDQYMHDIQNASIR